MGRFTQPIRQPRPKLITDLEALTLTEDIQTLELIEYLLGRLDKRTLSDDENEAATSLRRISFVVSACRNKARDRLRHFWLGGEVIPQRKRPQTLADINTIMKWSLEASYPAPKKVLNATTKPVV